MKSDDTSARSNLALRNWRKLRRNKLAMIGLAVAALMTMASLLAGIVAPYKSSAINLAEIARAPSPRHLMGTDKLGRDVLSQLLYGGRVSIYVGFVGAALGAAVGMVLGCAAGYRGGALDALLVRASELFLAFPNSILVLTLVGLLGQGVNNLIIVFVLTGWMTPFRLVRNEFLSLREETYVQVCTAFGIPEPSIMFRHILPNAINPIIVSTTVHVANYILQEAGLSFLGLGVPVTIPTWGNVMNAAKSIDVIRNYWWLWLYPGLVISIYVLSVNFAGDGLRDVLDPKQ